MKQKIATFVVVLIIIGLLSVIVLGSGNRKDRPQNMLIFFYGNTCPHCEDVEEWMVENKIEEKVKIVKKEVYDNRQNSLELVRAAKYCGLDTNNIGVPFLYAEGRCLIGAPEIINYLIEKTKD